MRGDEALKIGNHTQTALGSLVAAAGTLALGWQLQDDKSDALEDAHAGWKSCQETIQQIALRVSGMMEASP